MSDSTLIRLGLLRRSIELEYLRDAKYSVDSLISQELKKFPDIQRRMKEANEQFKEGVITEEEATEHIASGLQVAFENWSERDLRHVSIIFLNYYGKVE